MPREFEDAVAAAYERLREDLYGSLAEEIEDSAEPVPTLTYEEHQQQVGAADDIVLTLQAPTWCEPTFSKREHLERLETALESTYGDWLANADAVHRQGETVYAKVETDEPDRLPDFEGVLKETIESWSRAAISYCFRQRFAGRANALFYDRRDNQPPHPDSPLVEVESEGETREQFERWQEYRREGAGPRFEFRPAYVVNGDYGADGLDVVLWSVTEFDLELRLDVSPADRLSRGTSAGETAFPDARSLVAQGDRLHETIPKYARYIDVTPLDIPYTAP